MATESVIELDQQAGPKAFAPYDASMYMGWIGNIAELMSLCGKDPLPGKTVADLGYLILAMSESVVELNERDLEEARGTKANPA
jgi:hypothetical protein